MASKMVGKLVKPPISLYGVSGRYVNALYSAASKQNKLDAVESDLKKLSALYKTDSRFKDFMINPLVSPGQKSQIFATELKNKLKLNDLSVTFLSVVSENRRLKQLPDMESAFHQIMMSVRNELPCSVITAKPLADAKKKEVEDSLKSFTSKKLIIDFTTDPSIMGGMIVDFNGEHYIDMSVKSRVRLYSDCCWA
jgi:F-type H+-transporting ATPase subunit O